MARKQTTKKHGTKRRRSPTPRGEGVSDPPHGQQADMDSVVENFIPMQTTETIEERIERLRAELPEGYDIFSTEGMIDFGSSDIGADEEPEPQAAPLAIPEPLKPAPYFGRRVQFEKESPWVTELAEGRPLSLMTPAFLLPTPKSIEDDLKKIKAMGRDLPSQFWRLCSQAKTGANPALRNAAGRAVANIVDALLDSWPSKETYQTCITARIRQIKKDNEGFKQRWNDELHRRGVTKNRGDKDKPLERFVRDGEQRLAALSGEVIHAMLGGEHPSAMKVAKILAKWMQAIPGLMKKVEEEKHQQYSLTGRWDIGVMVDEAKLANVEDYFNQVFKPALESGLWRKLDYLGERKFSDHQGIMLTILRKELATNGY